MKKVLLTIFVAAMMVACHEAEIHTPSRAIEFGDVATRADITDLQDLQTNGFGVWAFITNAEMTNYPLMENRTVTYSDGEWVYEPIEYWLDATTYSFTALYPCDDKTLANVKVDGTAIELSVAETPSETDYLIAKNVTDTSVTGYDTTVSLQFQHILTSVGLNIWRDQGKHQNDQMRIRKVTLSNISKAGTLSVNTDIWTYTTDKLTLAVDNSENLSDDDNIGAAMVNDDGTLETGGSKPYEPFGQKMLLPQTMATGTVALKIEYDLLRQNAANWESAELEAALPAITWKAGNKYTYNIVLSSVTDITIYYIQTKVDQWGTPQVGGTVIIK